MNGPAAAALAGPAANPWPHRAASLVAACTFLLVIAGGLVTSTGSGLAVPDWPLSFGQVFPRMEGGVLFEHGHRMIAAAVGLLTIGLAVVLQRFEPRAWVRRLGWTALAVVVVQGLLGGLTVLTQLPDPVSVSHAGLAQIFFSLALTLAVTTSDAWRDARAEASPAAAGTRGLALATAVAVYAQILLGAIVRHTGAGLAIPDFPLANGRVVPAFTSVLVAWHYAHRVGAVLVAALIVWLTARVLRRHRGHAGLVRPAVVLAVLAGWQIFLGALTVLARRAVVPTTAHVAVGALLLAWAVALALRAHRLLEPAPAPGPGARAAG